MASMQCHKPAEESCHGHAREHSSLGKKVPDMASGWGFKSSHDENKHKELGQQEYTVVGTQSCTRTQCYDHGTTKTQTSYTETLVVPVPTPVSHGNEQKFNGQQHVHGANGGVECHGKKRGERKKKSLLERIKDGISGDSSSSESDSDDDRCTEKKN